MSIHDAVSRGCVEDVRDLAADVDQYDGDGRTPLEVALACVEEARVRQEVVRVLLDLGASTEKGNSNDGNTALCCAAALGDVEAAVTLVSGGGDPEAINYDGQTPFWLACAGGHVEMVRYLNGLGITPGPDDSNTTPFQAACDSNAPDVVELMLREGMVGEECDDDGHPPLWYAARAGHMGVVKVVLRMGGEGDCYKEDENGRTPAWLASNQGHDGVAMHLVQVDQEWMGQLPAPVHSSVHDAARAGDVAAVRSFSDDIGAYDENGMTPLLIAVDAFRPLVVAELVKMNVDVNQPDREGSDTPLGRAAAFGHLSIVQMLVAVAGIDVKNSQHIGTPALYWAADRNRQDIVDLLHLNSSDETH